MPKSRTIQSILSQLNVADTDRLVRMGWEDRSTFEAIREQFGISPNDFVRLMRHLLDKKTFNRWRRRVFEQGALKNETQRGFKVTRFKCSRQTTDGLTKGWK